MIRYIDRLLIQSRYYNHISIGESNKLKTNHNKRTNKGPGFEPIIVLKIENELTDKKTTVEGKI